MEKGPFYCSKCYRYFKTLDHFNRYANRQLVSPCKPISMEKGVKVQYDKKRHWIVVKETN